MDIPVSFKHCSCAQYEHMSCGLYVCDGVFERRGDDLMRHCTLQFHVTFVVDTIDSSSNISSTRRRKTTNVSGCDRTAVGLYLDAMLTDAASVVVLWHRRTGSYRKIARTKNMNIKVNATCTHMWHEFVC